MDRNIDRKVDIHSKEKLTQTFMHVSKSLFTANVIFVFSYVEEHEYINYIVVV